MWTTETKRLGGNMKNKDDVIEKMNHMAFAHLKSEYPFIYKQLLVDIRK